MLLLPPNRTRTGVVCLLWTLVGTGGRNLSTHECIYRPYVANESLLRLITLLGRRTAIFVIPSLLRQRLWRKGCGISMVVVVATTTLPGTAVVIVDAMVRLWVVSLSLFWFRRQCENENQYPGMILYVRVL